MQSAYGVPCSEVRAYFQMAGGLNGGTMASVMNMIKTGRVERSHDLAPMNPDLVSIQSGTKTVPRDPNHMNGWDYGPMNLSIIFYGSACSDLQTGIVQSVSAVYGCPPVS